MTDYLLEPVALSCPYCGERIELLIDCSLDAQDYIEDCPVCCRPMTVRVDIESSGQPRVQLLAENET
jgi:hypothetical protein